MTKKPNKSAYNFPKSPPTEDVDHLASREFEHRISPGWLSKQPKEDKGYDREVEIKEDGELRGKRFRVQIKGTESPSYDKERKYISCPLKVSTINYLTTYEPGMLCVCVVNEQTKPIYWIWLQEFIRQLQSTNPNWLKQASVAVNIPTSHILNSDSFKSIERFVVKYYDDMLIKAELGRVFGAPLLLTDDYYQPVSVEAQRIISKRVAPYLEHIGLADVSGDTDSQQIVPFSRANQILFNDIKQSSSYLRALEDKRAEEIQNRISKKIRTAPKSIQSRYFNNAGVLALHNGKLKKAVRYFEKASLLVPANSKFVINLLSAKFYLALSLGDINKILSEDFTKTLDYILKKEKSYLPAILLKCEYLTKIGSHEIALSLLRSSIAWKKGKLEAYIVLAGILFDKRSFGDIVKLFSTLKDESFFKDPLYWSIYGDAYFAMALGDNPRNYEVVGPGPANMDISLIRKAETCYLHAWELFKQKEFPLVSEQTVQNYSAVLILLGEYSKCDKFCSIFLEYHADSVSIIENYIAALNFQNNYLLSLKAADAARHAFSIQPGSSMVFQNLLLSLYICEAYDELITHVSKREKKGFIDITEEGFSRSFLALSYDVIGKTDLCNEQLDYLRAVPELSVDYSLAKAEISKSHSANSSDILTVLKSRPRNMEDPRILRKIISVLLPVRRANAQEIINAIFALSQMRQLTSEEYSIYGKAYLELGLPEKAYSVFHKGSIRYENDPKFLYLCAMAAFEAGNEIDSFKCLEQYLDSSEKDYTLLKNTALLARNIGKLDKSIILLEQSLRRATNPEQRAEIHCLLYEVKKAASKAPKELLGHAHEYGKLISEENKETELRYLFMFFLASMNFDFEEDAELNSWARTFQERLGNFLKQNPDHPSLQVFSVPQSIPDEKKAEYIINHIAYITLPQRLAIAPFELAIKSQPWPLAFRAQFLPGAHSIYDYWSYCIRSKEYSHAIHIWRPAHNIESEIAISNKREICIDITALLTLAEHDLLDLLSSNFNRVVLAEGTVLSLEYERLSPYGQLPIARKIYEWKQNNLKIVRVLNIIRKNGNEGNTNSAPIKVSLPINRTIDRAIGDGVGETLILAKRLGLPLYSDDTCLRSIAISEYNVDSFCTISFIARLKKGTTINLDKETRIYSKMLSQNYRTIPFSSDHLFSAIQQMLEERENLQLPTPNNDDLKAHLLLGPFLKQYTEPSLDYWSLANIAFDWWLKILDNYDCYRLELLRECMKFISFCLSTQRTASGVLTGIKRNENAHKAAQLWGYFLARCTVHKHSLNLYAWPAIRANCEELFPKNEKVKNDILYGEIPYHAVNFIWENKEIPEAEKAIFQQRITESLKYEGDIAKLEGALARYCIRLTKKRKRVQ